MRQRDTLVPLVMIAGFIVLDLMLFGSIGLPPENAYGWVGRGGLLILVAAFAVGLRNYLSQR